MSEKWIGKSRSEGGQSLGVLVDEETTQHVLREDCSPGRSRRRRLHWEGSSHGRLVQHHGAHSIIYSLALHTTR